MNGVEECAALILDRSVRDESTGCLVWQKCTVQKGYGQIRCDGRYTTTHRVAYRAAYGEIPDGMCVLHKCDNPACCEPTHLFLGTNKENIEDKVKKGRAGKKLTFSDACEVKRMITYKIPQKEIAEHFSVNQSLISRIKSDVLWPYSYAGGA